MALRGGGVGSHKGEGKGGKAQGRGGKEGEGVLVGVVGVVSLSLAEGGGVGWCRRERLQGEERVGEEERRGDRERVEG